MTEKELQESKELFKQAIEEGLSQKFDEVVAQAEERYHTLLRYKCKRCGFELERRYKSPDAYGGGMVTCTCGSFDLDPHPLWPRIGWRNGVDPHVDLEEYFETAPVEED